MYVYNTSTQRPATHIDYFRKKGGKINHGNEVSGLVVIPLCR